MYTNASEPLPISSNHAPVSRFFNAKPYSKSTASDLDGRRARLQTDMKNVNSLESKIATEMEELSAKIEKMKLELVTYSDVEGLKSSIATMKKQLLGLVAPLCLL